MPLSDRRQRLVSLRNRCATGVENERNEAVIARGTDQLDQHLFAEPRLGGCESGVADVLVMQQFPDEVIDQRLVGREFRRAPAHLDGVRDRWIQSGSRGMPAM